MDTIGWLQRSSSSSFEFLLSEGDLVERSWADMTEHASKLVKAILAR